MVSHGGTPSGRDDSRQCDITELEDGKSILKQLQAENILWFSEMMARQWLAEPMILDNVTFQIWMKVCYTVIHKNSGCLYQHEIMSKLS